jgi:hypothetical protein
MLIDHLSLVRGEGWGEHSIVLFLDLPRPLGERAGERVIEKG